MGLNWDPESDPFYFDFSKIHEYGKELRTTKRPMLKLSAKLFDERPSVIRLKILFQQLCLEKADWDKELQEGMRSKFLSYLSELPTLNQLRPPRCYFSSNSQIVST